MQHAIKIKLPKAPATELKSARDQIADALDTFTEASGNLAELEAEEAALSGEGQQPISELDHRDRDAIRKHEERLATIRILTTKIAERRGLLGPQLAKLAALIDEHEPTLRDGMWPAVEAEKARIGKELAPLFRDELAARAAAGRTHYIQNLVWFAQCGFLRADAKEVCASRFIETADAVLGGSIPFEFHREADLSAKPPAD